MPFGIISTTDLAGPTLSGGQGYLGRWYGLACENSHFRMKVRNGPPRAGAPVPCAARGPRRPEVFSHGQYTMAVHNGAPVGGSGTLANCASW